MSGVEFLQAEGYRPPELITLKHEGLEAIINPVGAIIESLNFTDEQGITRSLFLPRQEIVTAEGERVMRGGSHVCLPVYGEAEGLDRHGFGRQLPWQTQYSTNNAVALELNLTGSEPAKGVADYAGLRSRIYYEIGQTAGNPTLFMELQTSNTSSEPMRISPAFQPFFVLPKGVSADKVQLSSSRQKRSYSVEELAEGRSMVEARSFRMESVWVDMLARGFRICNVWSDDPDKFICVEPTRFGQHTTIDAPSNKLLNPNIPENRVEYNNSAHGYFSVGFIWKNLANA